MSKGKPQTIDRSSRNRPMRQAEVAARLAGKTCKAGPMHDRRAPKGGTRNAQADFVAEYYEDFD